MSSEHQPVWIRLRWDCYYTINKSQGLKIQKTIADLHPTDKVAGLAYMGFIKS